ncbi:vacuolar protein sorting-associated protein 4A-like [Ixodes scapularis]|uniref:vacuolar protein sorting-associated protein 4A-like n=1 Tax=Ixodes scapularis TaxID=6945 RepID=UPI001A9F47D0|nr:vacuolar protein sorting-associated protein 4A-like [Ixodes scapularis]
MVVPVTLTNDIKSAVDLSNQAADEDVKKQFANAIRLYRKSMESYLNAALIIRNTCAPFVERAQKLKEFSGEIDQEVICEGLPEMKRIHQLPLLGLVLPPWCIQAATVVSGRKVCYTNDITGVDSTKLVLSQIISEPKAKAASSVLLHGPTGSGKSLLVRAIASKWPEKSVFIVEMQTFILGAVEHDGTKVAQMLIRNFKKHNTGVLVIDNIDYLYETDHPDIKKAPVAAVKAVIVALFKGIHEKKNYKDLVIATANKPWLLEDDIKNAFHAKLNFPILSEEDRMAIIRGELAKIRCPTYHEEHMRDLVKKTERFSRYQLLRLVRFALTRNFNNIEGIQLKEDAERLAHLTKDDLDAVASVLLADIPEEYVTRYTEFVEKNPTAN